MDINNPVVRLCIEGSRAEYAGRQADASALYARAWELAADDYEACIAAHYVARHQETPEDTLRWNQTALRRAESAVNDPQDERVRAFYPSLFLSLGSSFEQLGNLSEAKRYYDLAAELGFPHNV